MTLRKSTPRWQSKFRVVLFLVLRRSVAKSELLKRRQPLVAVETTEDIRSVRLPSALVYVCIYVGTKGCVNMFCNNNGHILWGGGGSEFIFSFCSTFSFGVV
jgi:hypothetical protein